MLIATPLLQGQTLHPDVIDGVARTGLPWLVISAPAIAPHYPREMSINHTRDLLQQAVRRDYAHHGLILLIDSDVVIPDSAIDPMLCAIGGCHAVALRTKPPEYGELHTIAACTLMRVEDYLQLRYLDDLRKCQCQIIADRWELKYVEGIKAREVPR